MQLIYTGSRVLVGAVLAISGFSKLLEFNWFVQTLASYKLAPKVLTRFLGVVVVLAELCAGALLVAGRLMPWSAYGAVSLLVLFGASVLLSLLRGFVGECGCCGFWKSTRLGWRLLARNLGLALLAMLPAEGPSTGTVASVWALVIALALILGPIGESQLRKFFATPAHVRL